MNDLPSGLGGDYIEDIFAALADGYRIKDGVHSARCRHTVEVGD